MELLPGRGGARHFHLGGALAPLCRTFRKRPTECRTFRKRPTERDLILGGPLGGPGKILEGSGPPGTPLAPPLLPGKNSFISTTPNIGCFIPRHEMFKHM